MRVIAILLLLSFASRAEAQCGYGRSYAGYSYYAPSYCAPTYVQPTYVAPTYYPPLAVTYNIQLPNYADTGSTVYGYTYPQLTGFDPASFLNAGSRYQELAQQTAASGFSQFQSTGQKMFEQQQSLAEMRLRYQLAQSIMNAPAGLVQGSGAVQYKQGTGGDIQVQPGAAMQTPADGTAGPGPGTVAAAPASLQSIANTKCITCHGSSRKEKNLDLRDLQGLGADKVQTILERIMSDDPAVRMPPAGSTPLTARERIAFVAGAVGPSESSPSDKTAPPRPPVAPVAPLQPPVQPPKQ